MYVWRRAAHDAPRDFYPWRVRFPSGRITGRLAKDLYSWFHRNQNLLCDNMWAEQRWALTWSDSMCVAIKKWRLKCLSLTRFLFGGEESKLCRVFTSRKSFQSRWSCRLCEELMLDSVNLPQENTPELCFHLHSTRVTQRRRTPITSGTGVVVWKLEVSNDDKYKMMRITKFAKNKKRFYFEVL